MKVGQRFSYRTKKKTKGFALEQMTINPIENQVIAYINKETKLLKYTKNCILNFVVPDTKCNYEYKRINGKEYIFLEWKAEDYIFNNKIDGYYVLEKIGGINYMEEMFEKKDRIYSILTREGKGLTLGKDIVLPEDKRGNVNTLVIAGSGAGKSTSYTIPNVLKMLGAYIITDPFGEIYDKTHKFLKENGYKIKIVNYQNRYTISNQIDEEDKYQYNPLNHIKNDADIENLANILVGKEDEEFWNEACKTLIKATIYYVLAKEEKKDLLTCFKLIGLSKEKLFEKFDSFEENSKAQKYYTILKTFPEKTYQSVISTAIMKLSFVINGISEERDYQDDFEFMNLTNEKIAIFLIINENHIENKKLSNIFISQFLSTYTLGNEGKQHIYLLLNEVDQLGNIYNLSRNIENSRSRRISVSLLTNNLERLKNIYGNDFYSIINSIDTQMLLGTNVKKDIEYFSDLLGVDYEFIKNDLGNDQLLIYEKGLKAIIAEKAYFFREEKWRAI